MSSKIDRKEQSEKSKKAPAGAFLLMCKNLFSEIIAGPGKIGAERDGDVAYPYGQHPSSNDDIPSL